MAGLVLGFCLFAGSDDEKVGRRDPATKTADTTSITTAETHTATATEEAPAPVQQSEPATPETPAPEASLADAVRYLDSNRTWNRTEMDRFAALNGLFDDMNAMRIDEIISKWGPTLKESKTLQPWCAPPRARNARK